MTTQDTYAQTMLALGFPADHLPEIWREEWSASEETFAQAKTCFFETDLLAQAQEWIDLTDAQHKVLRNTLTGMQLDNAALRLAWHCQQNLSGTSPAINEGNVWHWPRLPQTHPLADGIYGIAVLASIPQMLRIHKKLGIPTEITRATLTDVRRWMDEYGAQTGRPGFANCAWLRYHLRGNLFELGRLQFNRERCRLPFTVLRHNTTGEVMALAKDGQRFRTDGQFDGANGIDDPEAWTATFSDTDEAWEGYQIAPHGHALHSTRRLSKSEWTCVLDEDMPVLGVHIPAAGPMKHDACGDSFARALPFFAKHFPEDTFAAFTCDSWLLDPQLANYLAPESNIVRFQREFYLTPSPHAADTQLLQRTFAYHFTTPEAATPTSSLQRAIVKHMLGGGRWRNQGGFILPDDLAWGKQVYQASQE